MDRGRRAVHTASEDQDRKEKEKGNSFPFSHRLGCSYTNEFTNFNVRLSLRFVDRSSCVTVDYLTGRTACESRRARKNRKKHCSHDFSPRSTRITVISVIGRSRLRARVSEDLFVARTYLSPHIYAPHVIRASPFTRPFIVRTRVRGYVHTHTRTHIYFSLRKRVCAR